MRTNRTNIRTAVAAVTTAAFLALALPATAHVGLEPAEVPAETGTTLSFRIGHGCEGDPTTGVAIQIPAGVASVKPFPLSNQFPADQWAKQYALNKWRGHVFCPSRCTEVIGRAAKQVLQECSGVEILPEASRWCKNGDLE